MTQEPIRISGWSGSRNVSTALMHAFAQRSDTRVYDEPLYTHYLSKTDAHSYHPGADEILKAQENDGCRVIDSKALLQVPDQGLRTICDFAGIHFSPLMLCWEQGAKPFNGVWAPHWYHNIHRSTAFKPYQPKTEAFPERLRPLLEKCQPHYDKLLEHSRS